jgi:hypothetical protein
MTAKTVAGSRDFIGDSHSHRVLLSAGKAARTETKCRTPHLGSPRIGGDPLQPAREQQAVMGMEVAAGSEGAASEGGSW